MFCAECGTESAGGKFCTNCGESLNSRETTNDKKKASNKSQQSSVKPNREKSTLSELENTLDSKGAFFQLSSLVNIESGDISFRTTSYPKSWGGDGCLGILNREDVCEEGCDSTSIGVPFFVDCKSCGRSPENYFWIKSGNGDGLYVVFKIILKENVKCTVGFIVVCLPTFDFSQPLVEKALAEGTEAWLAGLFTKQGLGELECFQVTTLRVPSGESLCITDKSSQTDGQDAIEWLDFTGSPVTNLKVYAFSDYQELNPDPEIEVVRDAISQSLGHRVDLPEFDIKPRLIVGIDEKFLKGSDFKPSLERPSGDALYHWWESLGTGSSHIQPEWDTAIFFSASIAQLRDDGLGMTSWLVQGALHGDEDCRKRLREERFANVLSDPKLVTACLQLRGQYQAANQIEESGKLPDFLTFQKQKSGFKGFFKK